MVDDGGASGHPLVVSTSPFDDIKGFSQKLFEEEPHRWGGIVPWNYPTAGTKESEDDFLHSQFSATDFGCRPTRFLAQVWKCIALYNAQCRIPAVVEQWIQDHSQGSLDDAKNASHIFKVDFNMTVFFQTSDLALYGEAFLKHVVKCIQFRLLQMEPLTKVAEIEKARMTSAHAASSPGTTSAKGADKPMSGPEETATKATSSVTASQKAPIIQATPKSSNMQVTTTSHLPTREYVDPPIEERPRRNSVNTHEFGDRRPQQSKKQRGNHNNKCNSFSRGQNRPPGLAGVHQVPNPYESQYSRFPSSGSDLGLPPMSTRRLPSAGPYYDYHQPMPPIMQAQPFQAPISGLYLPPDATPAVAHYATDQHRMRDSYAIASGSLGAAMNPDSTPFTMPHQVQPFMDSTNIRANAVSYINQGHTKGNESRGNKRRDSITSRGKRGSVRGRGSRGRNNLDHLGSMPPIEASVQRRFNVTRQRYIDGESWRNRTYDENTTPRILQRQDARISMVEQGFSSNDRPQWQQPLRQAAASSDNFEPSAGSASYRHQTRQPSISKQSNRQPDPFCVAGCTGSSVGPECLTALKVIVFNAPREMDSHSVWHFFSSFGDLWNVSEPQPSATRPDKHHIWVHFKDVMATRKCLSARGQPWPGGLQLCLEIAQQHHDPNHHSHKPSVQWQHFPTATAMPFFPSTHDPGPKNATQILPPDPQTLSDEPVPKAIASDDNASGMTLDVSSIGSGAPTPKKKGRITKQKKKKQTLCEDTSAKDLADTASQGDRKPSGDEKISVGVPDAGTASVVETKETTDDEDEDVVTSATAQLSRGPGILSKLTEDSTDVSSISASLSANTNIDSTSAQLDDLDSLTPDQESTKSDEIKSLAHVGAGNAFEAQVQPSDNSQAYVLNSGRNRSGSGSDCIEKADQTPTKDDVLFELNNTVDNAASPSPSNTKDRKKAPIPRVPISRAGSIVLPSNCNKKSYTSSEETGDYTADKEHSSQFCDISQQPKHTEISGSLEAIKTPVAAPASPAVVEEQQSQGPSLPLVMPKSKKAAKPKGPAQTESFSMFASRPKKEKRKTSKPVSAPAKDTKNDGRNPRSTTVPNKSPTNSGFVTSAVSRRTTDSTDTFQPCQASVDSQQDQLTDAINDDADGIGYDNVLSKHTPSVSGSGSRTEQLIPPSTLASQDKDYGTKSVTKAQQEHGVDDSRAVAGHATADQDSAVALVTETSTSSPRPSRRGTIGGLFDRVLNPFIGRGSSKSSQQDEDETYSAIKSAVEDSDAAVGTDGKLINVKSMDTNSSMRPDTGKISSGMTENQLELATIANKDTKKKLKKPKKSKSAELAAIVSDGDILRAGTDDRVSVMEHASNDVVSETSSQTIETVRHNSNSSPGKKVAIEMRKSKHIIEPKPLRKTHKRAASSKTPSANSVTAEVTASMKTAGAWRPSRAEKQVSVNDPLQSSSSSSGSLLLIFLNPVDENKQTLEADRIQNRIEDVTEVVQKPDRADGKVFDSKKKADTESRVSPEVEDAKARLNELAQREQKIKANKGKEMKEQGDMQ